MSDKLSNHEIVVVAVFLLGGDARHVDTEDIAVKANEIAPGRFVWRKYSDQINIETVRKRLWDAMREDKGAFLIGSEKEGWMLTERGLVFARSCASILRTVDLSGTRLPPGEERWRKRQHDRLAASDAFHKFVSGDLALITKRDLEAFFMLDDYVQGQNRRNQVLRIVRSFGSDATLGPAVQFLANILQKGE